MLKKTTLIGIALVAVIVAFLALDHYWSTHINIKEEDVKSIEIMRPNAEDGNEIIMIDQTMFSALLKDLSQIVFTKN